jgi:hypothetical protein
VRLQVGTLTVALVFSFARTTRLFWPGKVRSMIKTSKQLSAFRQISAAIDHFEKKDYECAITLAGAAEGQIKEKTLNHLFFV